MRSPQNAVVTFVQPFGIVRQPLVNAITRRGGSSRPFWYGAEASSRRLHLSTGSSGAERQGLPDCGSRRRLQATTTAVIVGAGSDLRSPRSAAIGSGEEHSRRAVPSKSAILHAALPAPVSATCELPAVNRRLVRPLAFTQTGASPGRSDPGKSRSRRQTPDPRKGGRVEFCPAEPAKRASSGAAETPSGSSKPGRMKPAARLRSRPSDRSRFRRPRLRGLCSSAACQQRAIRGPSKRSATSTAASGSAALRPRRGGGVSRSCLVRAGYGVSRPACGRLEVTAGSWMGKRSGCCSSSSRLCRAVSASAVSRGVRSGRA